MSKPTYRHDAQERLAEAIRDRCLRELQQAWEQAGISGLCGDGRWEVAIGRLRMLTGEELLGDLPTADDGS